MKIKMMDDLQFTQLKIIEYVHNYRTNYSINENFWLNGGIYSENINIIIIIIIKIFSICIMNHRHINRSQ